MSEKNLIRPYGDRKDDGVVQLSFVLPVPASEKAKEAAATVAKKLGLSHVLVSAMEKADRIEQINKQKQSGVQSVPPPLVSARMFDFGDTVMMIAREQRANAKAYFNTRMWVKREGRWQMLFSFNTRIE